MRIGVLSQWFPPESGSAAVPGVLADALADRGHRVTVITGYPNYPSGQLAPGYRIRRMTDERMGALDVRRVALYPSHDRSGVRRFLNYGSFAVSASVTATRLLREMDAIWVYNSPATVGLPSALASAAGGPPHLMHLMDLWPDSILYSGLTTPASYKVIDATVGRWCRWTYRRASAIACISRGIAGELARRGVPGDKLHYVPLWADEERYRPVEPDPRLRAELGAGSGLTILYAGNLGDAQGLDGLLNVCGRIDDLDVTVLVAGSGTAEARLRDKARSLRLANVKFLGRWPADDMARLLSTADVALVSLSADRLTSMTMPSKLPATLACERPVLAWARGEVIRTVEEGGCGLTATAGDEAALEAAIRLAGAASRDQLRGMGQASRRLYESRFSLRTGVERVEGLLVEMADRSRATRKNGWVNETAGAPR